MEFIIHYNGRYQDSLVVEGDTIEDIKTKASGECEKRGWDSKDCWSERMEDKS